MAEEERSVEGAAPEQDAEHRGTRGGEAAEVPRSEGAEEAAVEADLEALLADTKRERDEYLELAQRTRADFDNYRKRMAAEAEAAAGRGKAELAGKLLAVIDNLERALAAAGIDPANALAGEATAERPLEQGVLLTYRELSAALNGAGVEAYDPTGERFDPAWHDALQTRPEEGAESGTVVEVVQRGYRLNGQVLRAARVVVSQ
jgi:molecular chaperone GrpE